MINAYIAPWCWEADVSLAAQRITGTGRRSVYDSGGQCVWVHLIWPGTT